LRHFHHSVQPNVGIRSFDAA